MKQKIIILILAVSGMITAACQRRELPETVDPPELTLSVFSESGEEDGQIIEESLRVFAAVAAIEMEKTFNSLEIPSEDDVSDESDEKDNTNVEKSSSAEPQTEPQMKHPEYPDGAAVTLDPEWEFASFSMINSGNAVMYRASEGRKDIIVGVNAGHGTAGGGSVMTYCHPDMTPKVSGGTTAAGSVQAIAVSSGMTFADGTPESAVTLREAIILKDVLLQNGYDVLMIRESDDVQLDNVARTVICNNTADCHIAIHWDGDGLSYDKGCFYFSVHDGLKDMYPVSGIWQESDRLGECLISGLRAEGLPVFESGSMPADLTQISYSSVPSVDIELGNSASDHSDAILEMHARGICAGLNSYFS